MAISETKKKIVIDNYFKSECNVDTSIREAFAKGFEIGLEKGAGLKAETAEQLSWIPVSKDFPMEEELVEVTIRDDYNGPLWRYTDVGRYYKDLEVWIINNEIHRSDVIAWKPLTKEYEGEG